MAALTYNELNGDLFLVIRDIHEGADEFPGFEAFLVLLLPKELNEEFLESQL